MAKESKTPAEKVAGAITEAAKEVKGASIYDDAKEALQKQIKEGMDAALKTALETQIAGYDSLANLANAEPLKALATAIEAACKANGIHLSGSGSTGAAKGRKAGSGAAKGDVPEAEDTTENRKLAIEALKAKGGEGVARTVSGAIGEKEGHPVKANTLLAALVKAGKLENKGKQGKSPFPIYKIV